MTKHSIMEDEFPLKTFRHKNGSARLLWTYWNPSQKPLVPIQTSRQARLAKSVMRENDIHSWIDKINNRFVFGVDVVICAARLRIASTATNIDVYRC